jgi:hypothetical protein
LAEGAAAALLQPTPKTWIPAYAGMTRPGAEMTATRRDQPLVAAALFCC